MIKTTTVKSLLIIIFASFLFADTITVIAVGDIMMGSTYPTDNLPTKQGRDLFENVSPILKDADVTVGNLEGVFLTGGKTKKQIKKGRCYAFRMPPDFVSNLVDAGFDYMNLANNHMNDFGTEGIASTITALTNVGIEYGGPDGVIGRLEVGGRKIAIISFSTSPRTNSLFEIEEAQRIVAEQAKIHDIVIVSLHGGGEGVNFLHTRDTFEVFMGWPRGNVVKFAQAVVDSGADFVWGHGPHVPRALEIYNDRLIAYSLGNFCTWGFNLGDERGYAPILKVVLDSTGIFMQGEIISALQRTYQSPVIDTNNNAARLIKRLSIEDFPNTSPVIDDNGRIVLRLQH